MKDIICVHTDVPYVLLDSTQTDGNKYNVQVQGDKVCVMSKNLTEFIGKWSMVDVFVVAILSALIKMGNLLSIYPGVAALSFCATVVLTMLAANSFDPRTLWSDVKDDF